MYWKQVWNKSQTYFDGRFNSGAFFIYLTVRPSTDGKRAPLTAINLQAAGSPQQAPPTYIAKMWKLIKFIKNVIFWRNHTDINPDDWTITKKTIRTTIHENFSKMKNSKVDRWALSLTIVFVFYLWLPRRLLSPSLVAVVWYETWTPTCWCTTCVIGWSKYRFGDHIDLQWIVDKLECILFSRGRWEFLWFFKALQAYNYSVWRVFSKGLCGSLSGGL